MVSHLDSVPGNVFCEILFLTSSSLPYPTNIASFCGKANWVSEELVTCHSTSNDDERGDNSQPYQMCTNRKNTGMSKLSNLQEYVLASANNDATNDPYELGPPADDSYYPFNLIQGYWQVDSNSVQIGVTLAASSLLEDNKRSNVNAEMVALAYNQQLKQINLTFFREIK